MSTHSAREDFLAGVRTISPILVGVIPFGLVAGAAAVNAGLSVVEAVGMSVVIFAGASQLAAIDLIGRDAPVAVVVLTAIVINLRMAMYSASIAPHFQRLARVRKALAAYVLTDQAYAVSITEFRSDGERSKLAFYLGTALTLWVVWQLCTIVGAVVGSAVPDGLSLEFVVPLTFLALLVPAIEDRETGFAALVGAGVAVVGSTLPFNLGLLLGALVGILAGSALELWGER
ncbi:AzlC family ABC transporter permease [Natronomonas sp. EA1]|uniref:AzlC family ABC transporter permease n=1 Tax=Natronomonas sp. EA1 TaxID=3421655 RepID=UPI003EBCEA46